MMGRKNHADQTEFEADVLNRVSFSKDTNVPNLVIDSQVDMHTLE